ncbi:MAG: N-acetyltransferase [Chthoniobacteraceae bacterium]|nr:N-acetyltransferase [Chthoniobacteraceae bacterium]
MALLNEMKSDYEISTDPTRLDIGLIHEFLANSYWARGIPRSVVERSIKHSLVFGAYNNARQVGFARVTTDFATVAYIGDVFVIPEHRGRGISKLLLQAILSHPELQGLRRWFLATRDAHGLYSQFNFQPLAAPELFMTIHHPDVYQQAQDPCGNGS